MLFNSAGFLFVFLPATLFAFAGAVRLRSSASAVIVLLIASYVFYAQSGYWLAVLLAASTAFNYSTAFLINNLVRSHRDRFARALLAFGLCIDLGLLAYYKYANFFIENLERVTNSQFDLPAVALPIGISFYTFTQIAFLVDALRIRSKFPSPQDYFLFVSYFPHLVAGPIIHHENTIPQFRGMATGWNANLVAAGITIFTLGLFKKVMIADSLALFADASFKHAAAGSVSLADGWTGALAYSFQIYFDFSGYSDMAIGLSLLFGVRLPLNFASPYKATSIIEFWTRWHISLSRFLRDYLYIPLGGNRRGPLRRYFNLMVTMLLGGLWHGAGWTFVLWGGLHGLFLIANHVIRPVRLQKHVPGPTWMTWTKRIFVFLTVTIAWVFFRADSVSSAFVMLVGMTGRYGIGVIDRAAVCWLVACLVIVWAFPNVREIFARYEPTLPVRPEIAGQDPTWLKWQKTAAVATATAAIFVLCVFNLNRPSPFIYFRF